MLAAARPNDLGSFGFADELFFEAKQGLKTVCLVGVLLQTDLFKPQLFDLIFKITVLLTHAAKIEIVMPDAGGAGLDANNSFFERRNYAHRPQTNQPRT